MRDQRVHVNLKGAGASGQAEGTAGRRRKLAGERHVHQVATGAHEHASDAARVEGGHVRGIASGSGHRGTLVRGNVVHPRAGHLDAHAQIRGDTTHVLEGVSPVVGARIRHDTCGLGRAGQDAADMPGLGGNTCLQRGEHLVGGPLLRAGKRRGDGAVGTGNLGDLEEGDVRIGARDVAASDVKECVEHRGAQPRGIVRHRVAQAQGLAARIICGDTLAIPRIGHEGVGLDLDEAALGQRSGSQTACLLRCCQTVARRGGRHDNGNVVVAVEACDLFDQVGRQRQIGTPRGGSHREDVIHRTFDEAADRRQQLSDTLGAVSDAGQTLGLTHGQRNDGRADTLIHVGDTLIDCAATVFNEEFNSTLGSHRRKLRVGATLEALGGFGMQLVTAGAARDRHRVEVGGLEQDVRGSLLHLGVGTTHDASNTDDARALTLGRVGDEQVLLIQLALLIVQGHEQFTCACATHDDRRGQRAQVVGVHRLAQIQHDVVRDVDGQRQGTHTGGLEALDHPSRGRRGGVRAANDARDKAVNALAAADRRVVSKDHGEAVGVGCGRLSRDNTRQTRVAEGCARRVGVLARDAAHREAVATVRGHVDLEDFLAQTQPGHDVGADGGDLAVREVLGQHDDAVVVLPQTQLTCGADHAVRDVTVGLTRGDLEITR